MRRVAQRMGMPITVDVPSCKDRIVFDKIFDLFKEIDAKFSPYKNDSELSRYNNGELTKNELSREMKSVIAACEKYKLETNGYFDAWYKDFDPSGYVKGWAIKKGGDLIKRLGYETYCISAGGDILAASAGEKVWNIGIQDPKNKLDVLKILQISDGAVATSGSYERGEHIINPKTGIPATDLVSITVVGPNIISADVYATAAFAMGESGVKFVNEHKGFMAYAYPGK